MLLSGYFKPERKSSQTRRAERRACSWLCSNTKGPSSSGGNGEAPLCALCWAGTLFTNQPLTCLSSHMPRAYKTLHFLFSQKCSQFCVWWSNCSGHHWWDLEGKDVSTHSWTRFSEGKVHHFYHLQWGQLICMRKGTIKPLFILRVCLEDLQKPVAKCVWVYKILSDKDCEGLPVLGMVTSSQNREQLDPHKNCQEPGYRELFCARDSRTSRLQTAKGGLALLWHLSHHPGGLPVFTKSALWM